LTKVTFVLKPLQAYKLLYSLKPVNTYLSLVPAAHSFGSPQRRASALLTVGAAKMADHLASIFGTEKDRVNCPFYFKIG
jgi:hypothetical protein